MTQAKKDNNQIPVLLGTDSTDGITPTPLKASPSTHALKTNDNTTGSNLSGNIAYRDNNGYTVMMGVSNADGVTPVPIYALLSTGALLINHL